MLRRKEIRIARLCGNTLFLAISEQTQPVFENLFSLKQSAASNCSSFNTL